MLERFKKEEETPLDVQIAKVLEQMKQYGVETPEYSEALAYLERLTKLKKEEKRDRVKSDTIWIVTGNLVGILIVVAYERSHVMITRAKDHILKVNI